MIYNDYIDRLSFEVDSLSPRAKAALFWLIGMSLAKSLDPPSDWKQWISDARSVGLKFATSGEATDRAADLWTRAQDPTGPQATQLLHSVILLLSTPLGIAVDPAREVGPWIEQAFFPLIQSESLSMLDSIALPGDDEDLDAVFAQAAVQQAASAGERLLAQLRATPEPSTAMLAGLEEEASNFVPAPEQS